MRNINYNKLNIFRKKKEQSGFILAFALIVVAVLLTSALAVSKVVNKELFFTRLVINSRGAYFAADSGIECAIYIDNVLRDQSVGKSLILNSENTSDVNNEFFQNASNNVFFSSSTVLQIVNNLNEVACASDNGSSNKIFTQSPSGDNLGYVNSRDQVIANLSQAKSSYTIVADNMHATTTFGFVINNNTANSCVLVDFAKKSFDETNEATTYFAITSTGYSDCNPNNKSRTIRRIYRYSTD